MRTLISVSDPAEALSGLAPFDGLPMSDPPARRFPLPWTVHHGDGSYWVEDADGKRFGYCYFRDVTFTGSGTESHLTRDEAKRIAVNIAKLPGMKRS